MNNNMLTSEHLEDTLKGVRDRYPIATKQQVQDIIDSVFGTDVTPPTEGVFEHLYSQLRNLMPNTNMFDNWYFINPINQRGFSSVVATNITTTIDRWHTKGLSISLKSDGLHCKYAGVSGWIRQKTEYKNLEGKLVTVSWIVDNELYTGTAVVPNIDEDPSQIYFNDSMRSAINNFDTGVGCSLWMTDDKEHIITAAKLELGDHQTLAKQDKDGNWILNDPTPDPGIELLKCQRYVFILKLATIYAGRTTATNDNWDIFIPTPIAMRANPTFIGDIDDLVIFSSDKAPERVANLNRVIAESSGVMLGGTLSALTRGRTITAIFASKDAILDASLI